MALLLVIQRPIKLTKRQQALAAGRAALRPLTPSNAMKRSWPGVIGYFGLLRDAMCYSESGPLLNRRVPCTLE